MKSVKYVISDMVQVTIEDPASIKILYFLAINLTFMTAEMTYGYLSNSLGLISDGFHMLCDSVALFVGLLAAYVAKRSHKKTNK